MDSQLMGAFVNLGAVGLILWWLTQKLIPQLQQERSEAITSFREEMRLEREMHQRNIEQVIAHCQEELKVIIDSRNSS